MAFAVSNGALQAVSRPVYQSRHAVSLSPDRTMEYDAIYRANSSVQTVVSFLARNVSQLSLHTFERLSDTDRKRITDHPFARMMSRPNSRTTAFRLFRALISDRGIYDAAYWLKYYENGVPSLMRLSPKICQPGGKEDWLNPEYFEVKGSRGKVQLDPARVVYFRGYNPSNDIEGLSPIEGLRQMLVEEFAAHQMRDQMLRNGARASGYLERPAGAKWSDGAFERFRDQWQSQYAGNGPQAGGTPILEDGMKFTKTSMTPEELQYVEVRKLSREEAAAAYHIPPPMVGLLDHATFSNIQEQHKMLYQDTLGPWLEEIQQEIELQLLTEFPNAEKLYVEFNMQEKLRGSFEEQAAQLQTSVGAPYMTRNEARARANLPAIDGGDELIIPLNVLVGGQASPTDAAPDGALSGFRIPGKAITSRPVARVKAGATQAHRTKAQEVLAKFYARQEKSVRSALGAKADSDWWNEERWNEELAAELYALALLVTKAVANTTLDKLGISPDEYDAEMTLNYLATVARSTASSINTVTKQKLDEALASAEEPMDEVAHVFEVAKETRSKQGGYALVAALAGFATVEAIKQAAGGREATKTWIVTSTNPRPSHAQMSGETVSLNDTFSNGGKWPGDVVLGVDEIAGCTCDVEITFP